MALPHQRVLRPHELAFHPKIIPLTALIEPQEGVSQHGFARGGGTAISVYRSAPLRIEDRGFHTGGSLGSGEKAHVAVAHQPFYLSATEELYVASI